jgi:hypothetical protein
MWRSSGLAERDGLGWVGSAAIGKPHLLRIAGTLIATGSDQHGWNCQEAIQPDEELT